MNRGRILDLKPSRIVLRFCKCGPTTYAGAVVCFKNTPLTLEVDLHRVPLKVHQFTVEIIQQLEKIGIRVPISDIEYFIRKGISSHGTATSSSD